MSILFILSLSLWGCLTHAPFRSQPDTWVEFMHIWGPLLLALSVLRFCSYFPVTVVDLKLTSGSSRQKDLGFCVGVLAIAWCWLVCSPGKHCQMAIPFFQMSSLPSRIWPLFFFFFFTLLNILFRVVFIIHRKVGYSWNLLDHTGDRSLLSV